MIAEIVIRCKIGLMILRKGNSERGDKMNIDLEIRDIERKCRNLNYGWLILFALGSIFLAVSTIMPMMLGAGIFFFGSSILLFTAWTKQQNKIGMLKILKEVKSISKGRIKRK